VKFPQLTSAVLVVGLSWGQAIAESPSGVKTLSPAGAIKPTGTWDVGARAGDFIYVAGMRGIDPNTNALVQGEKRAFARRSSTCSSSRNQKEQLCAIACASSYT
jgi:2-iminobutanoate/2-iminopropanoate deaminase